MADHAETKTAETPSSTAKPTGTAAAPAKPPVKADKAGEAPPDRMRRRVIWTAIGGYLGVNFLMFLRFFFPRALYEPKTRFLIGYPSDFGFGVDTKFQNAHRIWVVRNTEGIFVISAICTHLGCTPDWKPSENKFKCPCHGSGYDPEGINFEGPAPRPMDRAHVELDPEGQIMVDLSHVYRWPKGEPSEFGADGAILRNV
jgi:cytochrome b6-f complex iron-sulfur subunit